MGYEITIGLLFLAIIGVALFFRRGRGNDGSGGSGTGSGGPTRKH